MRMMLLTGMLWLSLSVGLALAAEGTVGEGQSSTPDEPMGVPIQTLHLEMDKTDAEVLFRKEPHDDSKFDVWVRDGEQRLKGRVSVKGSFTRNFIKKSLKIKLSNGGDWRGYDVLSLNSMVTDPASMREWLVWDLIDRLGMAHPQVTYTRLFVNDHFIGLYLFIEWMTPTMFERFGAGADGEFFHPDDAEYCGDLTPEKLPRLTECWFKLAPGDGDYSQLEQLVEKIDTTPVEEFDRFLEASFDIDSLLNWILINTVVSSTDTYNKNYFLYYSKQRQKWIVVPWDYDLTFGRGADAGLPFPKNILNDNFQYYYSPELGNYNPLRDKTLSNPRLLKRFRAHMRHLFGLNDEGLPQAAFGWFDPSIFAARIDHVAQSIRPDLERDHYDQQPVAQIERHVEALKFYNLMRYHFLKNQVLTSSVFGSPRWIPFRTSAGYEDEALIPSRDDSPFPPERTYLPLVLSSSVWLQPGTARVVPVDEQLARPLGVLDTRNLLKLARIRMEVEMERRPTALPPGVDSPEQCIQRNWYFDLKTPNVRLEMVLTLDYLQEHSNHHEWGALVNEANEDRLQLWLHQQEHWQRVDSHRNTLANFFVTKPLVLDQAGQVLHFVACLSAE